MTYTEKHLDQVDAYLSRPGRNGGPPQRSPESSNDPSLQEAFHDVEMLWQATRLEKLQGKLEMLKKYEEEEAKAKAKAEETRETKIMSIQKRRWILSIAAGIALLVVAGWLIFRPQEPVAMQNQYLAMHFNDYILHDVMKNDDKAKYTSEQLLAYDMFAIKDFKKAVPLLKEQWEKKGDTLALFYLITIHFGIGEESAGKMLLQANQDMLSSNQRALLDQLKE